MNARERHEAAWAWATGKSEIEAWDDHGPDLEGCPACAGIDAIEAEAIARNNALLAEKVRAKFPEGASSGEMSFCRETLLRLLEDKAEPE